MKRINPGDLVKIADNLGPYTAVQTTGCEAIVVERHGSRYVLFLKGEGKRAWYEHAHLTFIRAAEWDMLEEWETEVDEMMAAAFDRLHAEIMRRRDKGNGRERAGLTIGQGQKTPQNANTEL